MTAPTGTSPCDEALRASFKVSLINLFICFILYPMDSNLQIISGKWRGKKLHLPLNARPTQNKARIALFNMLGNISPHIVWDAFAGSGEFGLEWLSRAQNSKAIFTDTNAESIKTIKRNLAL